jgi:hypothetical protein
MIENLGGDNYIYGNVFLGIRGGEGANGLSFDGPGRFYLYNNTFVAKSGSNNTIAVGSGISAIIRNNIIHTATQTALIVNGNMAVTRDHNLWFGANLPSCSGHTGELCNQDPRFTSYANNDFSLLLGSPAIGAGSNLGSSWNGYVVPGASWPHPTLGQRPASGSWAMGVHEYSSGNAALKAPSNLRVLQ